MSLNLFAAFAIIQRFPDHSDKTLYALDCWKLWILRSENVRRRDDKVLRKNVLEFW